MKLVIVESPAKAKTINKYLGSDYHVLASYGHVRDLPAKDGSVQPQDNFSMTWEVDAKAKKRLSEITQAAKKAEKLILATDPDREGEAISWHVLEVLKQKKALKDTPIERVVFNAVTKKAVLDALQNPRAINNPLVDAYRARRALDYLVGFSISPILWRKLPGARSAGRVQSVTLKLVCERESEIDRFISQEYWSLIAILKTQNQDLFEARIVGYDGEKIGRLDISSAERAQTIKSALEASSYHIVSVEAKPQRRNPHAPFTTSTLQQEASSKLGFAPIRTMQIAQRLYEGVDINGETVGLITYMRTDGVQVAPEAINQIRNVINRQYGESYLPEKARFYETKAKNAQEAHEAIRPTDLTRHPADLSKQLDKDQARLYELIWKRTIASQMASAVLERTTVEIDAHHPQGQARLRATGSVIRFDGFLSLYQSNRDEDEDEAKRLPSIQAGEEAKLQKADASQHFTEPPPRYTEASLIRKMEELGIGRPSTYAATLSVLKDREYVSTDKKRLIPEDKGRLVTAFLENFFTRYVEYNFTAALEEQLDNISAGDLDWKAVLTDFWNNFSTNIDDVKDLRVTQVIDALNDSLGDHIFPPNEDGSDPRLCPTCSNGQLSLKLGRYGSFIGCSNYPECRYTRQLSASNEENGEEETTDGPKQLGIDPQTGLEITLRSGRFGAYVQLGEPVDKEKPKRASLPKDWEAATLDLTKALALLSLPRDVGLHPETGEMITAGIGRYGPFVQHQKTYANLSSIDEVFEVGLNRAVAALAEKKERGGRGSTAVALKELGEHPDKGGAITVREGRYGPYVQHGKINATIPKDTQPEDITITTALELLAAKESKTKSTPKKSAPKKKRSTAKAK